MKIGFWGYPNGAIPASAMVDVEGFLFEPETGKRIAWAHAEIRRRGGTITTNEGFRPLGAPSDRTVTSESATSTGGSNQWFQKGREDRGETPSAAPPGHSNHGWGMAEDSNCDDMGLRAEVYAQAGLLFTIRSESWHADSSGDPSVDLSGVAVAAVSPPEPVIRKKKKMSLGDLVWNTNGTGILFTFDGIQLPIPSPQMYVLLYRIIRSDQSISPFNPGAPGMPDQFFQAELDMCTQFTSLARITRQTGVTIDGVKLAAALSDALKGKSITAGGISTTDLAAAINEAVPRIAAAVTKAAGAKLSA